MSDWLGHTSRFGYDPDGNLTSETYPNGVHADLRYDSLDRLVSLADATDTDQLLQLDTPRSNAGLVKSEATGDYTYDPAGRLTGVSGPPASGYDYDAADRLTSSSVTGEPSQTQTLTYDAASQLQRQVGGDGTALTYGYDAEGNRTSRTDQTGHATSYAYDQNNQQTAAGVDVAYAYDGDGLRISKTVSGTTERFVWDVSGRLPLLIGDGPTSFVTGPDGLPLEQIGGDGTVVFFHQDQLGSTRMLTDTGGAVVARYAYDPYGRQTSESGSASTPLRFAGQYLDRESGLYYLRARYYDPATAQFTSRDPLASLATQPYAYAQDSPVNATDPSSRWCLAVGFFQLGTCLSTPPLQLPKPKPSPTPTKKQQEACECSATLTARQIGPDTVQFLANVSSPSDAGIEQVTWDFSAIAMPKGATGPIRPIVARAEINGTNEFLVPSSEVAFGTTATIVPPVDPGEVKWHHLVWGTAMLSNGTTCRFSAWTGDGFADVLDPSSWPES